MKSRQDFSSEQEYQEYLRTYFAGLAMQGLCASGIATNKNIIAQSESVGSTTTKAVAIFAVEIADEILKQLNQ